MPRQTRFQCPSSLLQCSLLMRTRKALCIGLAMALAAHGGLSQLHGVTRERKTAKPLTTHFVKRRPRLTKPLELKKRPRPKRREMQRETISVKARARREQASAQMVASHVLSSLARPYVQLGRFVRFGVTTTEPQTLSQLMEGAKEGEDRIDMFLEMMDIEALDTGQYHALVVQDPYDRKSIRGFLHLAVVYSPSMYPPKYPEFEDWIAPVIVQLAEAMDKYTDVRTDMLGRLSLSSAEILKAPWLYFMAFWPFRLTDTELDNLGRYMLSGGLVFADSRPYEVNAPLWMGGSLSIQSSLVRALALHDLQAEFEVLPNSHPLYHCYFDFDGPPIAAGWGRATPESTRFPYLEALAPRGRVLALLSKRGYYQPWAAWRGVMSSHNLDNTRQLQFGVNTIIFALTQEGSITHRLMESVR